MSAKSEIGHSILVDLVTKHDKVLFISLHTDMAEDYSDEATYKGYKRFKIKKGFWKISNKKIINRKDVIFGRCKGKGNEFITRWAVGDGKGIIFNFRVIPYSFAKMHISKGLTALIAKKDIVIK